MGDTRITIESKLFSIQAICSVTIPGHIMHKTPFKKYHLISLGCAKNSVDSRSMAELLERAGIEEVDKPALADVLIINTCGFIAPAREESLQALKDAAKAKRKGQVLIAAGCLSQRDREQLVRQVPGIDGILGTRRWMDILSVIHELENSPRQSVYHIPESMSIGKDEHGVIRAAVQGGSAYLKIGDGCDRLCAFCSIPLIKGPSISRPLRDILHDARQLQGEKVKEIILISQDTTSYGLDLKMKDGLVQLLQEMIRSLPGIPWIRCLYMFPGAISDKLIQIMSENKQILHYLDLPLQHAHPDVLRRMKRPSDMDIVQRSIEKMRAVMPDLALRTTFIVGFPGETEEEYQTLLDFVKATRFDRVGIFPYYHETGTPAESLGDSVPAQIKEERLQCLAKIQETISLENNKNFIGQTLDVLVEGIDQNIIIGRTYRDAPEIDGLVIADGQAKVGQMVRVQINGALVHDLSGTILP
jgi:ribosomal protein S12 methylthiotransferase